MKLSYYIDQISIIIFLNYHEKNSSYTIRDIENHKQVQDKTEDVGLNLSVERASPGDHLGSQVSTNGRRPSVSQEQWTPAKKRKSRGSKGSQGSPDNQVKKGREEGEWVWQGCSQ